MFSLSVKSLYILMATSVLLTFLSTALKFRAVAEIICKGKKTGFKNVNYAFVLLIAFPKTCYVSSQ